MVDYFYVAADYYATGEGRTIMLLITRAYPRSEDYEVQGGFVDGKWTPGVLKDNINERLIREFATRFDSYYAIGADILSREEFMKRFGQYIPISVVKLLDEEEFVPGNLFYSSEFHVNFS